MGSSPIWLYSWQEMLKSNLIAFALYRYLNNN